MPRGPPSSRSPTASPSEPSKVVRAKAMRALILSARSSLISTAWQYSHSPPAARPIRNRRRLSHSHKSDLRPETPLRNLLSNDFWGRPLAAVHSVKSYRPLTVLTFRANFIQHGLSVEGFHIVNVALHAACTRSSASARLLSACGDAVAASVASLAFAVHPVHAEAVASIVGRAELLLRVLSALPAVAPLRVCRPGRGAEQLRQSPRRRYPRRGRHSEQGDGITAPAAAAAIDVLDALPASRRAARDCCVRCAVVSPPP